MTEGLITSPWEAAGCDDPLEYIGLACPPSKIRKAKRQGIPKKQARREWTLRKMEEDARKGKNYF